MTAMREGRQRLDEALVERNLAETRARARALVLAGDVLVDGEPARAAGTAVRADQEISLRVKPRFVSRGGEKLDHALDVFKVDVSDLVCADFGASTGGFTDCLLSRGAQRVYAVDVGYGQIHQRLREDERVVVMERCNVRTLDSLPEPIDLVVIDVSFISLKLVLPSAATVLRDGGRCIPLIKPQFEAGKGQVGKGGVVRDPAIHESVLRQALQAGTEAGFTTHGLTRSPLTGPAGNIEFLALMLKGDDTALATDDLLAAVGYGHATV